MSRIFKYDLPIDGGMRVINMNNPRDISVDLDRDNWPCMWAAVDDNGEEGENYGVYCFGTGWLLPDNIDDFDFIGRVNHNGYIWHYYIKKDSGSEN